MQRYFDVNLNSYGMPANGEPKKAKNETTASTTSPASMDQRSVMVTLSTSALLKFLGNSWDQCGNQPSNYPSWLAS